MSYNEKMTLYPAYKQASKEADLAFTYGDIIPMEWITGRSGIDIPHEKATMNEWRDIQLKTMSHVEGFKEDMLVLYKKSLKNVRGEGYLIIKPENQAGESLQGLANNLKKAFRRAGANIANVNHDLLNDEQRQRNNDAAAQVARIAAMSKSHLINRERKPLKLKDTDEDDLQSVA